MKTTTTETGRGINWDMVEGLEAEIASAHKAGNKTAERAARGQWELAMGITVEADDARIAREAIAIYSGRSIFKASGTLR
jgi:hypothetical protein